MIPDSVDPELCGLLLDHNKGSDRVPAGKGGMSVYFLDSWSKQGMAWSDEEIYQRALVKVEQVMPGISALVEGYYVKRWDWAATLSYPGYYKELAGFVAGLDLQRRVQLAGDYFSLASVNTAVTSGKLAADRLAARYL
jgi:protoporphyrinogen oxidase